MLIEETILRHLNSKLPVPAYAERPEEPEKSYVILEKTGSRLRDHIQGSTIALQSYAEDMYQAAELNEQVKAVMLQAAELPEIGKVALNADYNNTDSTTKEYRYQAVFDITHY